MYDSLLPFYYINGLRSEDKIKRRRPGRKLCGVFCWVLILSCGVLSPAKLIYINLQSDQIIMSLMISHAFARLTQLCDGDIRVEQRRLEVRVAEVSPDCILRHVRGAISDQDCGRGRSSLLLAEIEEAVGGQDGEAVVDQD